MAPMNALAIRILHTHTHTKEAQNQMSQFGENICALVLKPTLEKWM